MAIDDDKKDVEQNVLNTVEGEISFFRSLMRARPVGIHRHFHVLSMRSAIHKDTGRLVTPDQIWEKLRSCYDLDALEGLETDGYDSPGSNPSIPDQRRSPSPSENLSIHPHFREEYSLPHDPSFENLIAQRRVRSSLSVPSSPPAPSPPVASTRGKRGGPRTRGRRAGKGRKRRNTAGLIAGDSDSSALTQESGDESVAPTPMESVVTGTDAGSDAEMVEDEEDEERDASAEPSKSSRKTVTKKRGSGRPRGGGPSRPTKKKKRG